ncbi:ATP-binding protein [Streptomyces sp. KR80]|uniref:ATP-binding protein n=1 Tax=Streptomyces sp. KR80 TaxID=3457426 RepID=UPI003FD1D89A
MSQARPGISQLALADTPNAVASARRHAVDVLRHWQVAPDLVETARLLVSELTTNAIRHPKPDRNTSSDSLLSTVRTVTVTLRLDAWRLLLMVQDNDRRPPVVKTVGEAAENGRGLFLVGCMSTRWGYYHPTPRPGKVVWAELSLGPITDRPSSDPGEKQPPPLLLARALDGLRGLRVASRAIRQPHTSVQLA